MSGLQHVQDDGPPPCRLCGAPSAGPCARCGKLVCADCCTLTKNSAKVWAVCLGCEGAAETEVAGRWGGLLLWLGGILLVMLVIVICLGAVAGK